MCASEENVRTSCARFGLRPVAREAILLISSPNLEAAASPSSREDLGSGRKAILWLSLACIAWGWSFPAMQKGPEALRQAGGLASLPASATVFCGWRFLVAALAYGLLTWRRQRGYTRPDLRGGLTVGLASAAGMTLQVIGLQYTSPSVSGFITALYVVLLPVAELALRRRAHSAWLWLAVLLALGGLTALSWPGEGQAAGQEQAAAPFPFFGEVLTALGSAAFTVQILCVEHFGAKADTARLTLLSFLLMGAGCLAVGLLSPGGAALHSRAVLSAVARDWTFGWAFWSTVLFSSVAAFHLMNRFQPRIQASTAGVIYTLEPVWAAGFSCLLGMERLRWQLALGGGLVLVALWLVSATRAPLVEKNH
jgi:drug/metabolite transporter (DMT)-like permease